MRRFRGVQSGHLQQRECLRFRRLPRQRRVRHDFLRQYRRREPVLCRPDPQPARTVRLEREEPRFLPVLLRARIFRAVLVGPGCLRAVVFGPVLFCARVLGSGFFRPVVFGSVRFSALQLRSGL